LIRLTTKADLDHSDSVLHHFAQVQVQLQVQAQLQDPEMEDAGSSCSAAGKLRVASCSWTPLHDTAVPRKRLGDPRYQAPNTVVRYGVQSTERRAISMKVCIKEDNIVQRDQSADHRHRGLHFQYAPLQSYHWTWKKGIRTPPLNRHVPLRWLAGCWLRICQLQFGDAPSCSSKSISLILFYSIRRTFTALYVVWAGGSDKPFRKSSFVAAAHPETFNSR
jgi:hypothetical protein